MLNKFLVHEKSYNCLKLGKRFDSLKFMAEKILYLEVHQIIYETYDEDDRKISPLSVILL